MPAKKKRIIREVDRRRFKEVEPEDEGFEEREGGEFEESEESLEQELSGGDDFAEFISGGGETRAPVLESVDGAQAAEPIEDALQDVQTSGRGREERGARADYEEAAVYNMPDYDAGVYETEMQEDMRRREPERVALPLIRPDEALASDTMRPVRMARPEEERMQGQGERGQEDYVMRARHIEEERGLPFEKKKRK